MSSGKARFNRPATAAARLAGKAPAIETPITSQFKQDIRKCVDKLKPLDTRYPPDADDLATLVEQIAVASDWAWGQVRSQSAALTNADMMAECKKVSKSVKCAAKDLRHMSWDVDLALGEGFDGQDIADDAKALASKLDDTVKRLAVLFSSRSTGSRVTKRSSISERRGIGDELVNRIAQAINEAGLKVTASRQSPVVQLTKQIGDEIGLSFDLTTWRDRISQVNRPKSRPSR